MCDKEVKSHEEEKTVKKRTERIDESKIDWSEFMDECEKWRKIIHSLHLPEEVLDDDDAF